MPLRLTIGPCSAQVPNGGPQILPKPRQLHRVNLIFTRLDLRARYFYLDRLMPMVIGIDKKLAIQPSLSRDTLGC